MTESFLNLSVKDQLKKSIDGISVYQNVDYLEIFIQHHINGINILEEDVVSALQESCTQLVPVLIQAAGIYPETTSEAFHMIARIDGIESKLVKTQYFQATLEFLNSFPENEEVLINCIESVSMLSIDTGLRSTVAQVGILEKIIELFPDNLHRSELIVMFLKCFVNCLYTLLGNKLIFIEEDGVGFIIDILNESSIMNDSNIIYYATLVLRNALHLDRKDYTSILEQKHPRITQQILSLIKLYSSNPDAQIHLFWCLTNLMYNDTTVKEIICEKDGASTVLNTLRKHKDNKQLIQGALICLNQMAKKKYSRISISVEGGAADTFRFIKTYKGEDIELFGLLLLVTLSKESTGKKKIMEAEMIEYLVDILKETENTKIQSEILNLFSQVSSGGQSTKKALKALKLTAVLMESITRFDNDARLRKIAQDAMENLFKPSDYDEEIEETPMFTDDDIDFSFLLKDNGDDLRNDILKDFSESFQYEFESSTTDEEVDVHLELNLVREQLQKEQREKALLQVELDSLRKYVIDMNTEKDSLPSHEEVEKYKKRAQALEERYKLYKGKSRELEAEIQDHEDSLTNHKEKKIALKTEKEQLISDKEGLEVEVSELKRLLLLSTDEIKILEPLIDELRTQNNKYENSNGDLSLRIGELEKQNSRIPELEKDLLRMGELEKELARIGELEKALSKMAQLEKSLGQMVSLQKENEKLQHTFLEFDSERSKLQERIENLEIKEKSYQDEIADLGSQRDDAEARANSGGDQIKLYVMGVFAVGCLGIAVATYYFS